MITDSWNTRAEAVLPGDVSFNVRLSAPKVCFTGGAGSRLFDIDGKEYVDVLPYNDETAVQQAFTDIGDDVAAVIVEPVMCNSGVIPPNPASWIFFATCARRPELY